MRVNMRLKSQSPPLMTFALFFAMSSAAASLAQEVGRPYEGADHRKRVVASGRFTGGRELQRVVTWQTREGGHLAIEQGTPHPRILWQTNGRDAESRVDSVRVADLDNDGLPEIISLWRKRSDLGAELRVAHWDRMRDSFVEVQSDNEINQVHRYRIVPVVRNRASSRIVVEQRSADSDARSTVPGVEYELRGSKLTRVGGGRVVTQGESGIEGQAVISPSHPGPVRQGESDSAPYKATLVVWGAEGDREITRFETGPDGRFRVALPPGAYRVGSPAQKGRFLPRASEESVTVTSGRYTKVTISFDSGMR
jgi:hypothetical protein